MIRGLIWVWLIMFSQNVIGETLAQNAMAWIDTRYPNASLQQPVRVLELVEAHAALNGVPPNLVLAVMATESSFKKRARSPSGAVGLMQVVPRWHHDKIRGRDLNKPDVAIEVGVVILRDCLNRTRSQTGALRCYSGYRGQQAQVYVRTVLKKMNDLVSFEQDTGRVRMQLVQQFPVPRMTYVD